MTELVTHTRLYPLLAGLVLVAAVVTGLWRMDFVPAVTGEDGPGLSATGFASVHFLDVGQGDAIVIHTEKRTTLIDAGSSSEGPRVVTYLNRLHVDELDYVIATHPHSDHIGGLYSVFTLLSVRRVFDARVKYDSRTYERMLSTILELGIPYGVLRAGMTVPLGRESVFDVLWPAEDPDSLQTHTTGDINDLSIVGRLHIGGVRLLMTGDISGSVERTLIRNLGDELAADVLKVAHHGSRHSTTDVFLAVVEPSDAIISCGRNNPYGHPHSETLERLRAAGVTVYRTDLRGTVVVYTDGRQYWIVPER